MSAYGDDDYQPQTYQDDTTTDDNVVDPIMQEENDDPTEELGVPADKFRDELVGQRDDEHTDDLPDGHNDDDILDDQLNYTEDQAENDDSSATTGSGPNTPIS